jgi:hypothetical protein
MAKVASHARLSLGPAAAQPHVRIQGATPTRRRDVCAGSRTGRHYQMTCFGAAFVLALRPVRP